MYFDDDNNSELHVLHQKGATSQIRTDDINAQWQYSFLGTALRSIGLQVLKVLAPWHRPLTLLEPAKVAIHSRPTSVLARLAVHVLPVLAAITLLVINALNVRMDRTTWYNTLQFVAKIHEIAMQASIAAILMAYVRQKMLSGTPFGAIFAGIQTANLSYL